jgi:hypothetical protein
MILTGIIFPFTFMCTQYLYYIHSPTPFPCILPLPLVPIRQAESVLQFCKRKKKWHFCLLKIATQGISLWHFHVCMY